MHIFQSSKRACIQPFKCMLYKHFGKQLRISDNFQGLSNFTPMYLSKRKEVELKNTRKLA